MKNVENAKRSSWKNDMPFIWPKATKKTNFTFTTWFERQKVSCI